MNEAGEQKITTNNEQVVLDDVTFLPKEKTIPAEIVRLIEKGSVENIEPLIRAHKYQEESVNQEGDNLLAHFINVSQNERGFLSDINRKSRISAMLNAGCNPLQENKYEQNSFYYAVRHDDYLSAQLILSSLNNAQLKSLREKELYSGNTFLHLAVRYCSPKMVKMLLSYQFDPNKQNDAGETPLHRLDIRAESATANAFFNVKGAIKPDLSIRNKAGLTAEQYNMNLPEIHSILNRERRKAILTRQKLSYQERRLGYLKKQAVKNIRMLKRKREYLRQSFSRV